MWSGLVTQCRSTGWLQSQCHSRCRAQGSPGATVQGGFQSHGVMAGTRLRAHRSWCKAAWSLGITVRGGFGHPVAGARLVDRFLSQSRVALVRQCHNIRQAQGSHSVNSPGWLQSRGVTACSSPRAQPVSRHMPGAGSTWCHSTHRSDCSPGVMVRGAWCHSVEGGCHQVLCCAPSVSVCCSCGPPVSRHGMALCQCHSLGRVQSPGVTACPWDTARPGHGVRWLCPCCHGMSPLSRPTRGSLPAPLARIPRPRCRSCCVRSGGGCSLPPSPLLPGRCRGWARARTGNEVGALPGPVRRRPGKAGPDEPNRTESSGAEPRESQRSRTETS